ncbi:TetR/AcrR family transcriptional regulator [Reyranella sp. CPCC 100927]|uniref:TetR/AcrR family transcriptional regulator n=1 Tax=Reyranella sp. CPCC 100927 TaxID=2599616 RepID=UPI0011B67007|nr:TetR/AcrR family transcriptional regulator [Reyranella sp. CPCC 100927]TWT15352.1 TetR/AcrR family transcriptional regulator [Reyranella sp. CPCC 100927]
MPRDDGENMPDWRQRRRADILRAAADLFGRRGYGGVQVDDVARAAGVGKPTLYRYFASKEELFLQVFGDALAGLEADLEAIRSRETSQQAALVAMVTCLVDVLGEQMVSLRVLTGEQPELADRWRILFRGRRRPIQDALRTAIAAGIESGEFRAVDPDVLPALLLGMIRGGLMGVPDASRAQLAQSAVDLVLRGCLAGPGNPSHDT